MLLVINNSDWTLFMYAWGNADNAAPTDSMHYRQVKSADGKSGLTCLSLWAGM